MLFEEFLSACVNCVMLLVEYALDFPLMTQFLKGKQPFLVSAQALCRCLIVRTYVDVRVQVLLCARAIVVVHRHTSLG